MKSDTTDGRRARARLSLEEFQLKRDRVGSRDTGNARISPVRSVWRKLGALLTPAPNQENLQSRPPTSKHFGYISGWPGDTYRYRCEHQAEVLNYAGFGADVYEPFAIPSRDLLERHRVVVVHRLPCTDQFEAFVSAARRTGIVLVFDTDDLIFDPDKLHHMHAFNDMDDVAKSSLIERVAGCKVSIGLCDGVIVSTDKLQAEIRRMFPGTPVSVVRNRMSSAMVTTALAAKQLPLAGDGFIRIAYFSGTNTHDRDFAECVAALKTALGEFPEAKLMIVGYLNVPQELEEFRSRIEVYPFVPWRELPALYRKVDINLAPLERANDFTESKSELKYFEAALLGLPTIASDTTSFRVAISNGVNGRLCADGTQWSAAVRELVMNRQLRESLGRRALEDVTARYTTRAAVPETVQRWKELLTEMST